MLTKFLVRVMIGVDRIFFLRKKRERNSPSRIQFEIHGMDSLSELGWEAKSDDDVDPGENVVEIDDRKKQRERNLMGWQGQVVDKNKC